MRLTDWTSVYLSAQPSCGNVNATSRVIFTSIRSVATFSVPPAQTLSLPLQSTSFRGATVPNRHSRVQGSRLSGFIALSPDAKTHQCAPWHACGLGLGRLIRRIRRLSNHLSHLKARHPAHQTPSTDPPLQHITSIQQTHTSPPWRKVYEPAEKSQTGQSSVPGFSVRSKVREPND